jgi:branched-chain amino acid transport system permease protein
MSPLDLFSLFINAVLLAGLYATMSYGLALIYGVMKIVNLSHAGFMMLGAYAAFVLISPVYGVQLNPFIPPLIIVPLFFVGGMALYHYVVRRVMGAPMITSLLLLFGIWLILQNIAYILFTADTRTITIPWLLQPIRVGELRISTNRSIVFAIGVVVLIALQQFMSRTMLGKAIRATATDADAAALVGVNTRRVQMIAFGMGIALAGLAGALMSLVYSFDPDWGRSHLLKSFSIVVLGGLESFVGVALGSIVLSLIETFSIPLGVPTALQDFVSFALLVIVLVVMPGGIMGLLQRRT